MEFTIKKIISIDKNAQKFREKIEKGLEEEKRELDNTIISMNEIAESRIEDRKKYLKESRLKEATLTAQNIISEGKVYSENILKNFYERKEIISDEIFNKLIASFKEE